MTYTFEFALIIEGNKTNSFIHEHLLRNLGVAHHIHKTYDGMSTVRFIQNYWEQLPDGPKLIVLCMDMKDISGLELLHYLQVALSEGGYLMENNYIVTMAEKESPSRQLAQNYELLDHITLPLTKIKLERLVARFDLTMMKKLIYTEEY